MSPTISPAAMTGFPSIYPCVFRKNPTMTKKSPTNFKTTTCLFILFYIKRL